MDFLKKIVMLLTVCLFAQSSCASGPVEQTRKVEQKKDLQTPLEPVNWKKMKEVRVALNEYSIVQPQADSPFLVLKVGQPYKLNISNVGRKVHVFSASSFFRKIALLKIGFGKNTEIESSRVNNIMIGAGKTVSLYFVPLEKGTYKVVCALPLHLNAGMQSQIVVQGG